MFPASYMIVIVDYGMGNLGSIVNMFKKIGAKAGISGDPEVIATAPKLLLPGVGSFDRAMERIHELDLKPVLDEQALVAKKPILGICLGMQLLGVSSTEDGLTEGLGLVKNTVTKLIGPNEVSIKIPHVGFNRVQMPKESKLFDQISIVASFYFVHSYAMQILDDSSKYATTTYGQKFVAAIESGQVFGTQFHPEKSQKSGLKVLKNFLR